MTIENYSLREHNTFGIPARCSYFAEYRTPEELRSILAEHSGEQMFHIGGGSNLLFLDDYKGVVLHSQIKDIQCLNGEDLRVGAAVVWDDLVEFSLSHGYYGLENLSLIPGEVGASAVQNIGAYGTEAADFISCVECMSLTTGELHTFTNEECHYAYRQSIFKTPEYRGKWAVLYVTYHLSPCFTPHLDYGGIRAELLRQQIPVESLTAQQLRQVIIDIRCSKLPDPKEQGNAGSFFMNPIIPRSQYESLLDIHPSMPHYDVDASRVKVPAGWLIEQCGWKGKALGRAGVHDRQALVLVNLGGASGNDILRLCDRIRQDVSSLFGIDIKPEVNFIGSTLA